jgi:hypothetical protein
VRNLFVAVVAVAVAAGSARAMAQSSAAATTPPPPAPAPQGALAPAAAPDAAGSPAPAAPQSPEDVAGEQASAAQARAVGAIPTADATPAASDHDAVVGHFGIEARRFDPGPLPLTLRAGLGCPVGATCAEVSMGVLGGRYWWTRNLAWNAGLAFGAGGGRAGTVALDTYYGFGPVAGLSVLLGNWRHVAIMASPELAFVWFRPGAADAGGRTTMFSMRGALEAELHFGFVGVPSLSIGLIAGMRFQYESAADTRLWSIGVIGDGSVWDALTNLYVRYYL